MKIGTEKQLKRFAGHVARMGRCTSANQILFGNTPSPKILVKGERFYWTNKSGDIIRHPSAYSIKGFSSMVYHHATPTIVLLPYHIINWDKI